MSSEARKDQMQKFAKKFPTTDAPEYFYFAPGGDGNGGEARRVDNVYRVLAPSALRGRRLSTVQESHSSPRALTHGGLRAVKKLLSHTEGVHMMLSECAPNARALFRASALRLPQRGPASSCPRAQGPGKRVQLSDAPHALERAGTATAKHSCRRKMCNSLHTHKKRLQPRECTRLP